MQNMCYGHKGCQITKAACIKKHSDSRLIFHIADYVVRESLKKFLCPECACSLCILHVQEECNESALLTCEFDHAGLICPSEPVEELDMNIKSPFTELNELHAGSMAEFLRFLQGAELK